MGTFQINPQVSIPPLITVISLTLAKQVFQHVFATDYILELTPGEKKGKLLLSSRCRNDWFVTQIAFRSTASGTSMLICSLCLRCFRCYRQFIQKKAGDELQGNWNFLFFLMYFNLKRNCGMTCYSFLQRADFITLQWIYESQFRFRERKFL